MKSTILKVTFAAIIFLGAGLISKGAKATTEDGSGGFTCPDGDKYKCIEKNGYIIYKGAGDMPVQM